MFESILTTTYNFHRMADVILLKNDHIINERPVTVILVPENFEMICPFSLITVGSGSVYILHLYV